MNKYKISALLFLLLFTFPTLGQIKQKNPVVRKKATLAVESSEAPNYQIDIKISADTSLSVSIVSPGNSEFLDPLALDQFIADLPGGNTKFNSRSIRFPKVLIHSDPGIEMLDLFNPITLFPYGAFDMTIEIPNSPSVKVSRAKDEDNLKPNPLALFVVVDKSGRVSLNNEPAGTVSKLNELIARLKEIFKARGENGVYRTGTTEIEKTVTIKAPLSGVKIFQIGAVAKAVEDSGTNLIYLTPDFESAVDIRKPLKDKL